MAVDPVVTRLSWRDHEDATLVTIARSVLWDYQRRHGTSTPPDLGELARIARRYTRDDATIHQTVARIAKNLGYGLDAEVAAVLADDQPLGSLIRERAADGSIGVDAKDNTSDELVIGSAARALARKLVPTPQSPMLRPMILSALALDKAQTIAKSVAGLRRRPA